MQVKRQKETIPEHGLTARKKTKENLWMPAVNAFNFTKSSRVLLTCIMCFAFWLANKGEYIDLLGHCQFCEASCSKCTGPSSKDCIDCVSTSFLDDGHCVLQCPKGKFGFQNQCHSCHPTCMECTGSEPNKCTACRKDEQGNMLFLYLGECRESCPVGHYPSEKDNTCTPCLEHCEVCLDQTECERCFEGYYLTDNTCQEHKCRKGEVEGLNSEDCVPCADGCLSCNLDDPRTCTSCTHNYYMYNQRCYRSCPQNTYSDENSLLCIECQPNCRSCDKYECYWCKEGFFLLDGKCVSDCGAGFYSDDVSEECEPCHRSCATCKGFSYDDCTSCKGILQLFHGKCMNPKSKQVYGKFWNDRLMLHNSNGLSSAYLKDHLLPYVPSQSLQPAENDLLMVPSMHQIRAERALKEAFSVADPLFQMPLPLEVRQNPSLSIIRKKSTATQFQPCDPSCKTCDKTADTCTSCSKERFLSAGSCVHVCPQGSFGNVKTRQCENCADDCEECTRVEHCLKCLSDSDVPRYLYRGRCLQACPTGYFVEDGSCKMCSKSCNTCKGNATRCLSCESPLLLEDWECKLACSEKHFADDGFCRPCPDMCLECIHGSSCKACVPPYHLHNGNCLLDCPSGFFPDSSRCFACHEDCRECDGPDSDDCTDCPTFYYALYNGKCFEECPDGTYYNSERRKCQECDSTCQTCSASTYCLTCGEGLLLTDTGLCAAPRLCSRTEYYEEETKMCRSCHRNCLDCTGPAENQCLSCPQTWLLLNATCVNICPDGYYVDHDESQCYACHRTCETCYGKHSTQCISCPPRWYKQEHGCVQICATGYYANNVTNTCERCHKTCKECLGPASTDCMSCDEDFFLLHSSNECHISCPESYYEDHDKHTCERCHPTCLTCNGKGPFSCTSCVWSYQLAAGICNSECLMGKYKISEDPSRCEECHDSCMQCKGPGPQNCTVCHLNMELYLDENRCVPCCKSSEVQTQECCDCSEMRDECILHSANLSEETRGKARALVVAILILLMLTTGAIIFIWRRSRAKPKPVNQSGYEKLADNAKALSSFKNNHYQSSSYQEDQVIEYKDRDEDDDDDDDDIVYMGQDGTVYRKFKYGLLEDDEVDDLEYDDESYSFR